MKRRLPAVTPQGHIVATVRKTDMRAAISVVFEMLGGTDALYEWAKDNPEKFYLQLMTKVIERPMEVTLRRSVEDELRELEIEDADYSVVERDDAA